jgi:hypothetical protein
MGPPPRKRQKKEKAPQTSAESDLRLQSMKSLLELIRDEEPDKAQNGSATSPRSIPANVITADATVGSQRAPAAARPSFPGICAICMSRRSRVRKLHEA